MGRQGYPAEFRARAVALIEGGKRIRDLAHELGVSEQTLYTWRKQARVDRDETSGLTTSEKAELASMRKRVRELEAEILVTHGFDAGPYAPGLVDLSELAGTAAAFWEPLMSRFTDDLLAQIRFEEAFVARTLAGDSLPPGTVLTVAPDLGPMAGPAARLSARGMIQLQGNLSRDSRVCEGAEDCECDDDLSSLCSEASWQCVLGRCLVVSP